MSEYGFQGMPNLETLQKVMSKDDLNFTSEAFKNHQNTLLDLKPLTNT